MGPVGLWKFSIVPREVLDIPRVDSASRPSSESGFPVLGVSPVDPAIMG